MGLDEEARDPDKPVRAIERLRGLLAPGGRLWARCRWATTPKLDERIRDGRLPFDRVRALRRDSHRQGWREVDLDQVWDAAYDRLLFSASGLLVASWTADRPGSRRRQCRHARTPTRPPAAAAARDQARLRPIASSSSGDSARGLAP